MSLLKENEKEMEILRDVIKEQETIEEQARNEEEASYAAVTARPAPKVQPNYMATNSVAVTSKNVIDTREEVLEEIRKVVNVSEEGLQIYRIRKAKDRKIIIGCSSLEELGKVKERLKRATKQLIVEDIKNKDPQIVLKDLRSCNTDDDFLYTLKI